MDLVVETKPRGLWRLRLVSAVRWLPRRLLLAAARWAVRRIVFDVRAGGGAWTRYQPRLEVEELVDR